MRISLLTGMISGWLRNTSDFMRKDGLDMIEKIVQNFIKSKGIHVYLETPDEQPEEYVLIQKTGSIRDHAVNGAIIAIQSIANSKFKAALLNEKIIKAMETIIELDDICRCDLNSDYDYTDTKKKKYRYQAVFNIVYYDKEE